MIETKEEGSSGRIKMHNILGTVMMISETLYLVQYQELLLVSQWMDPHLVELEDIVVEQPYTVEMDIPPP